MSSRDLLERKMTALEEQLRQLQEEVGVLRREVEGRDHPVTRLLAQRGLQILSHGDRGQLLFPHDLPEDQKTRFFHLMRRYSFRLFLRDLIQNPRGNHMRALTRYCSLKTVRVYMKELEEMGIVEFTAQGAYHLRRTRMPSFGPTLEWYVSEILQRDFLSPALFNVKLKNTRFGGDYDVIGNVGHRLLYLEAKSSPPRGVELPNVISFLKRLGDLQPNVAIFLVDTELRMKDKIAPLFTEAIDQAGLSKDIPPVERMVDEIFHVGHVIYMTNSRRGIYSNLRKCIHDFLRQSGPGTLTVTGFFEKWNTDPGG